MAAATEKTEKRGPHIVDKELRRAPRIKASLEVIILPRDADSNHGIAEPVTGRVNDVSIHGVRITVPRINSGTCHLFYSFNDDPSRVLVLEIPENGITDKIHIPMHPVWFDHVLSDPSRPFQLGMEFLVPPDNPAVRRLQELLNIEQRAAGQQRCGWFKRLFSIGSWWRNSTTTGNPGTPGAG